MQGYDASKIRVDNFTSFLICKNRDYFAFLHKSSGHTSQNRDKSRKTGTYGHPSISSTNTILKRKEIPIKGISSPFIHPTNRKQKGRSRSPAEATNTKIKGKSMTNT